MFQSNGLVPNGLDTEDRKPGSTGSVFDEMDGLMSDWSWRPRLRDLRPPVYVYNEIERDAWQAYHELGVQLPGQQPWSFPAYKGLPERPPRIGG